MSKTIETILTADSSVLRAEFAKAEKMSEEYERKVARGQSAARTASLDNVRALQLEATGRKAAADALRQEISLKAEAARLSKATGMSEEGAISVLRRKLELEQRITEQKARAARIAPGGGSALPDMPLTPAYLQTIEKAAARTQELRRQTLAAGRSGQNGAMGFLAFSQAVEDAQYGIRGVLNNIPQMIMGFGGTMGLAGALSLAAVAGVALYPVLKRLYGAADTERLKKASQAWKEVFEEGTKVIDQRNSERYISEDITEFLEKQRLLEEGTVKVRNEGIIALEKQLLARRSEAELANEIAEAQKRLTQSKHGEFAGDFKSEMESQIDGLKQELEIKKQIAAESAKEAERIAARKKELDELREGELSQMSGQIDVLTKNLAAASANIAQAKKELEAEDLEARDRDAANYNVMRGGIAKEAIQKELDVLQARRDALKGHSANVGDQMDAGGDDMRKRAEAAADEVKQLEKVITSREKLLGIQKEQEKVDRESKQKAANLKSQEERLALDMESKEKQLSQTGARTDFAQEMAVLALQAQGRTSAAAALEKEIALRREAVGMAKEMGITEEQALNALRRREEMIRRGEAVKGKGQREDKARSRTDFARGNKVGFSRDSTVGFARDGLRNAAAEKAALKDPGAKDRGAAASYYEKSLEQGDMLVKIFDKLGIA